MEQPNGVENIVQLPLKFSLEFQLAAVGQKSVHGGRNSRFQSGLLIPCSGGVQGMVGCKDGVGNERHVSCCFEVTDYSLQ